MSSPLGRTIRWHLTISGILLLIVALVSGPESIPSTVAGSLLGLLSLGTFTILSRILRPGAKTRSRFALGLLMLAKYPLIFVAIYLIIVVLALDPLQVSLGFGAFPVALILGLGKVPSSRIPAAGGASNE